MWIMFCSLVLTVNVFCDSKLPDNAVRCYGVVSKEDAINGYELFESKPCDPAAFLWLLRDDCASLYRGKKGYQSYFGCVVPEGCVEVDVCHVDPQKLIEAKEAMEKASLEKKKKQKIGLVKKFNPRAVRKKRRSIPYATQPKKPLY